MRGRGGGLRLARAAGAINLGAVVRATEEGLAIVECFDPTANACVVAPACGLRAPLREALEAFFSVLDVYSLADLIHAPQRRMRRLLADAPALEARP